MATSTYAYLKKGGQKVLVDAAIRDRNGKVIDAHYATLAAHQQLRTDHDTLRTEYDYFNAAVNQELNDIESYIPTDTTSTNTLTNLNQVKQMVLTEAATHRGTFATWSAVPTETSGYLPDESGSKTPDKNDVIIVTDASGYTPQTGESATSGTWMFKYSGTWSSTTGKSGWHPFFQISQIVLTPAQLDALNSGITADKVFLYDLDRDRFANYTPTNFKPTARTDTTYNQEVFIDGTSGKLYVKPTTKSDVGLGSVTNGLHAGGTAVTLNGTSKADSSASFYAPTAAGTNGQFLKSNGSGAPTWGSLPTATQNALGVVKATTKPSNANTLFVYVDTDGMLTAEKDPHMVVTSDMSVGQILGVRSISGTKSIAWYTPKANGSDWGFVNPTAKIDSTLTQQVYLDTSTGKLYTNPGEVYTLPPASANTLGGVKVAGASTSGVAYFNTYMTASNVLVVERGIAGSSQLGCVKASTIASTTNHAAIQIDSSGNMYDDFTSTSRTINDEDEPAAA